jgi:DNA-binding response OmpR family regulator
MLAETRARTGRLLVVDDEPAVCELVAEVARQLGYEVETASSSRQVESALSRRHDLTVLDLHPGDVAAVAVLRRLVEVGTTARVVLMSGSNDSLASGVEVASTIRGLDIVATCRKPMDLRTLRCLLTAVAPRTDARSAC